MTDTWEAILHVKSKNTHLREKMRKRKQQMQKLESELNLKGQLSDLSHGASVMEQPPLKKEVLNVDLTASSEDVEMIEDGKKAAPVEQLSNEQVETELLRILADVGVSIELPVEVDKLISTRARNLKNNQRQVNELLQKFDVQNIVTLEECQRDSGVEVIITNVDNAKLLALQDDDGSDAEKKTLRDGEGKSSGANRGDTDLENLLLAQTAKERETQRLNEEIMELLNKPTAKEKSLLEKFRSQGGSQVQEFCPFSTKEECVKMRPANTQCRKLHFRKIIQPHTDESLGDCSFLNTCFHFQTCKYVHYEIDQSGGPPLTQQTISALSHGVAGSNVGGQALRNPSSSVINAGRTSLYPPQWVQCDVRTLNMKILGKFAILMADPPWDIHMELPYGTMSDDEMRQLDIPCLQDEGYMFLWVTGRAMELGRECLKLWGYERVDEIIWVKTNQLQRIIRTGRTGHWINHGKEHCLVGAKGELKDVNKGLDCDVIVSEVRATSHKPDEIYGIIERLSPGTRKLELFGRPHNVQPNWITLGNQLDGVRLLDPEVVERYKKHYPNGYTIKGSNV